MTSLYQRALEEIMQEEDRRCLEWLQEAARDSDPLTESLDSLRNRVQTFTLKV